MAARSGFGSPVLQGDQFVGAVGHIFISFGALFTGVPPTCAAHVPPSAVRAMSADGVHTAARIAAVLQQPEVLAALGAALAPFLARQAGDAGQQAPHAASAAPAARAGRSRSRGPPGVASAPAAPPTAEAATIAALQRQVAALHETIVLPRQELAAARGEPAGAPAKLRGAAAAAPRAPAPDAARAAPRAQPRPNLAPGAWILAGRQRGQKRQVSPSPACYWEGSGDARRNLMHQAARRCIGPSGTAAPECFPPHPLAATRPYWAKEDVKPEEGVVNLNSFTIRRYCSS